MNDKEIRELLRLLKEGQAAALDPNPKDPGSVVRYLDWAMEMLENEMPTMESAECPVE